MKLNDILGFGKVLPIDKLIEIISNSVGKISKHYFDKKDVDTKVYEIEKLAEARAKEMKIMAIAVKENYLLTGGIEFKNENIVINSPKELSVETPQQLFITSPLEERTKDRINYQESKKQVNIENITSFAAEELKNEETVTDEPLDEDWTTRFFGIAEEVSNEEMQALWGKILAGEIKQPKSYSLRTLELIKNLSKNEAEIFIKVANFASKIGNSNFVFTGNDKILDTTYNISYGETALLAEIGLLQPGNFVSYQLLENPIETKHVLTSGNIVVIITVKPNNPTIQMPVLVFSNAGNELLKLLKPNAPIEYLSNIAKSIKNENVEIKYGIILDWEGDTIIHTQPLMEFNP